MIGVVVPAHEEALSIGACLRAIRAAAKTPLLGGETVKVVVVLDACTDATGVVARSLGAATVSVDACNVGLARAAGAVLLPRDSGALSQRWKGPRHHAE